MYQDTSFYIRLMTKSKGSAKSQVRMGRSQCPLCWVACTLWYPSGTICIISQNYLNVPNVWHPKYYRWGFIISVILMILLVWQITHWSMVLKSKRWGLTCEYIWPKKKKKQRKKKTQQSRKKWSFFMLRHAHQRHKGVAGEGICRCRTQTKHVTILRKK